MAGKVAKFFASVGVETFLAHEQIKVSEDWQTEIFKHLGKMDIFVALVTENYCDSSYCLQESGVAVYRSDDVTIAPLSLDGTVPPGCMGHIQAGHIDPENIDRSTLFAILAKHDIEFAIDLLVKNLAKSTSYAEAARRFEMLSPYLGDATNEQIADVLEAAASNGQIWACWECQPSLKNLLKSHGKYLKKTTRARLTELLAE